MAKTKKDGKDSQVLVFSNDTRIRFYDDSGNKDRCEFEVNRGQAAFEGNQDQELTVGIGRAGGWFFTRDDMAALFNWLADRIAERPTGKAPDVSGRKYSRRHP